MELLLKERIVLTQVTVAFHKKKGWGQVSAEPQGQSDAAASPDPKVAAKIRSWGIKEKEGERG